MGCLQLHVFCLGSSVGLYRDDGLAVMRSHSGSNADRVRKDLIKVFQTCGLKITVQTNLKAVNFLDVTLDLNTASYQPYRKPNDDPIYINRLSNHPPTILKNIPQSIERKISELSSSEEAFYKTAPVFNVALKSAGYDYDIEYQDTLPTRQRKKTRSRKIIWYNPPFSKNVRTNIGAHFLKLISKHFPEGNKLHKIFNKNTLKVSYSCMRNIQQIIKSHNTDVTKRANQEPKQKTCNC